MQKVPIAKTWADLQAWMAALLAAPLAKEALAISDKVVGLRLAMHLNIKTGRCFPKVEPTLTNGTAMTRQGVQGALQRLIAGGWIIRVSRIGTSSEFKFLMSRVSAELAVFDEQEQTEGVPAAVGTPRQQPLAGDANHGWQGCQQPLAHNIEPNIEVNTELKSPPAASLALTASIEGASTPRGLPGRGPTSRPRMPRTDGKRGQYEMEIRDALGGAVFDELSEAKIEGLCARWPHGLVSANDLDALRLQHASAANRSNTKIALKNK